MQGQLVSPGRVRFLSQHHGCVAGGSSHAARCRSGSVGRRGSRDWGGALNRVAALRQAQRGDFGKDGIGCVQNQQSLTSTQSLQSAAGGVPAIEDVRRGRIAPAQAAAMRAQPPAGAGVHAPHPGPDSKVTGNPGARAARAWARPWIVTARGSFMTGWFVPKGCLTFKPLRALSSSGTRRAEQECRGRHGPDEAARLEQALARIARAVARRPVHAVAGGDLPLA